MQPCLREFHYKFQYYGASASKLADSTRGKQRFEHCNITLQHTFQFLRISKRRPRKIG